MAAPKRKPGKTLVNKAPSKPSKPMKKQAASKADAKKSPPKAAAKKQVAPKKLVAAKKSVAPKSKPVVKNKPKPSPAKSTPVSLGEIVPVSPENPIEAAEALIEELEAVIESAEREAELVADEPVAEPVAEIRSAVAEAAPTLGEIEAALEALLFASPEPVTLKKLTDALDTGGDDAPDSKTVLQALHHLSESYDREGRGLQIAETHGGWRMGTRERFFERIYRLGAKKKRHALSPATLETLAIIAYRQPVIRAVVETIRGVETSGMIRNLLDLGLIEISGYKEVIGRPPLYSTTAKFLTAFGLRSLADLPSIRGLKERFAAPEVVLTAPSEPVRGEIADPRAEIIPMGAESEENPIANALAEAAGMADADAGDEGDELDMDEDEDEDEFEEDDLDDDDEDNDLDDDDLDDDEDFEDDEDLDDEDDFDDDDEEDFEDDEDDGDDDDDERD